MSDETAEKLSEPRASASLPVPASAPAPDARNESTGAPPGMATTPDKGREPAAAEVSMIKAKMQDHLPALDDDGDVGVRKEHVVTRDGKADLRFNGVLLASAAPGVGARRALAGISHLPDRGRQACVFESDTHRA